MKPSQDIQGQAAEVERDYSVEVAGGEMFFQRRGNRSGSCRVRARFDDGGGLSAEAVSLSPLCDIPAEAFEAAALNRCARSLGAHPAQEASR